MTDREQEKAVSVRPAVFPPLHSPAVQTSQLASLLQTQLLFGSSHSEPQGQGHPGLHSDFRVIRPHFTICLNPPQRWARITVDLNFNTLQRCFLLPDYPERILGLFPTVADPRHLLPSHLIPLRKECHAGLKGFPGLLCHSLLFMHENHTLIVPPRVLNQNPALMLRPGFLLHFPQTQSLPLRTSLNAFHRPSLIQQHDLWSQD